MGNESSKNSGGNGRTGGKPARISKKEQRRLSELGNTLHALASANVPVGTATPEAGSGKVEIGDYVDVRSSRRNHWFPASVVNMRISKKIASVCVRYEDGEIYRDEWIEFGSGR